MSELERYFLISLGIIVCLAIIAFLNMLIPAAVQSFLNGLQLP